MFNEEVWKKQLQDLSNDELKQVEKLVTEAIANSDTREEFIDVLRRWKKKFPKAKYFYTGAEWKGAYECSGEWGTYEWTDIPDYEDLFSIKHNPDGDSEVEILEGFETYKDFENAVLNANIMNDDIDESVWRQFEKEINAAKNVPTHDLTDAQNLYNGDTRHEFIDIDTGISYELYTSA